MKIPFNLPPVAPGLPFPHWDGLIFQCGEISTPFLEYSENFSGWSDDLTALHEEASGDSHPIDLASRGTAIKGIELATTASALGVYPVLMEIGCSSGFLLSDLVRRFPSWIILGADVVKAPLFRLSKQLPGIPLIRFDLLKCPLPEECLDILVMLNVLEHIEDDLLALKNAFKLLKPGGVIIVEVPACQYLYDQYDKDLHHFRRYSQSDLCLKLEKAGFVVDKKSHLGFLLFPAFAIVKILNKLKGNNESPGYVHSKASSTSSSVIVRWAMNLEFKFMKNLSLPFGIRVTATARRP